MIGQYIQNYKIVAHLGEGGMGSVYRASDTVLGREVALKMLHSPLISQSQFLERFKKEARMLAQLLHPNIAVIYNFIEQNGQHYMVMEYVEGQNLDALMRKHKPLSYQVVVPMFLQALEGLQHAHKKGIFHRDIKPSNLILTPDGTVKLMDFGIAKMAGEQRLTQVNRVVGTIEFMAPELIEGKDPSVASDIYATGVTMYELLTGSLPFESKTDFNLMQEILKKKPVSIEKMNSSVPRALSDIVMKALEKKPENRYADARSFQHALITAFPQLKEVDTASLAASINTAPATQFIQVVTSAPKTELYDPGLQATREENTTRPVNILRNLQQKFLHKKKRNFAIAGLLLALIIAATFTFSSNKTVGPLTKGDSISVKKPQVIDPPESNIPASNETNNPGITLPQNPVYVPMKPIDKGEPVTKTKPNKPVEKKENEKPKEEEPEIPSNTEKVKSPKTITIRTRAVVKVRLSGTLDPKNLREGQSIHFTVVSPVEYDDEIIVKQGATVNGTITGVGSVLIDIDVNSIETAGGQKVSLDRTRFKGKRRDVDDNREIYSFSLGRGVTIKL